ncbi:hypothetical protein [Actinoplanes sp. GCM10030250]|uniref:hypothetical protein n=1 Tax=Actinoplanes sp. GCM10030250 TaxID=3273376 RepID=UPI00361E2CEC
MARHGRVARTPVSLREPTVLPSGQKPPPEADAVVGGRDNAGRDELVRLAEALLVEPTHQQRSRQRRGLARVLDWLESFPGEGWQDRWLLADGDEAGTGWGPAGLTAGQRQRLTAGLGVLIVLRAVRPSYPWLCGSRLLGVYAAFRRHNHASVFAELEQTASDRGAGEYAAEAVNLLTRMVIVTGKDPRELDLADFITYADARRGSGRTVAALPFAYEILHAAGGLHGLPTTLRQARSRGQLSVAELVDRYLVACRPVRDVLVHYLTERAAALDYGSLVNQVQALVDLFWADLERHHPGINSLHLPDSVAQAWKQRVRTLPNGRPRRNVHTVLLIVRSLYLDLRQWSLEDPARWAIWAAPCPIGEADVRGYVKETRQRQARMQERTRTLIPVLPRLIAAASEHLERTRVLLDTIRDVRPGEEFTVASERFQRAGRERSHWRPTALFAVPLDEPGPRFDVERLEDNAFWTWATVEVLRRTGARIEELLEVTHLSLRQYQAPTGEKVPLLQISPSKTDTERVIPADPDLVAVLARIIRRVKDANGKVPLLSRYDGYERKFGPPLPHLFQRVTHHRLQVIPPDRVRELDAVLQAHDITGGPGWLIDMLALTRRRLQGGTQTHAH